MIKKFNYNLYYNGQNLRFFEVGICPIRGYATSEEAKWDINPVMLPFEIFRVADELAYSGVKLDPRRIDYDFFNDEVDYVDWEGSPITENDFVEVEAEIDWDYLPIKKIGLAEVKRYMCSKSWDV